LLVRKTSSIWMWSLAYVTQAYIPNITRQHSVKQIPHHLTLMNTTLSYDGNLFEPTIGTLYFQRRKDLFQMFDYNIGLHD